jgi:hypothetical protein
MSVKHFFPWVVWDVKCGLKFDFVAVIKFLEIIIWIM